MTGPFQMPFFGAPASQEDSWPAANVSVGVSTTPRRLRIGYSGLVPPGECGSSYFVYPLGGIEVGASLPLRLANAFDVKFYGSYLFTRSVDADQQITWLTFPSGIRHWRRSSTDSYTLGAEILSPLGSGTALVGGTRWESLTTTFKDPNPEYLLTVDTMQAQVTVTMYEPYVGFRFQQGVGPGGLTVRLVGFPFFLATIQHFNTCNKDGDPLAHVGHANVSRGYFVEAAVEYRLGLPQGLEASGFVAWDVYRGQVPMYLERINAALGNSTTGAVVDFSYDRTSLIVGGKVELFWR